MAIYLNNESIWFDQYKFMDAERDYYTKLAQRLLGGDGVTTAAVTQRAKSPLIEQISNASPAEKEMVPSSRVEPAPPSIVKSAPAKEKVDTKVAAPAVAKEVVMAAAPTVEKEVAEAAPKPILTPQKQQIHQSLASPPKAGSGDGVGLADLTNRMQKLELENAELKQVTTDLKNMVTKLSSRVEQLEKKTVAPAAAAAPVKAAPAAAPVKVAPPPAKKEEEEEDDDDFDMFGSDDDDDEVDEEAEKLKQERLAAYAAKKGKKPALIAKSSILLDVKPWDDETDMKEMEKLVRTIEMDGLLWGQGLLKPIGYGIHKLTINCIVEDDKVSIEELSEKIEEFEDFVQSVDVAAFNKI
jgi:elongation factor 1-delta